MLKSVALNACIMGSCRERLEARKNEEQAAVAAVQQLTQREQEVEGQLEEASKQLRQLQEEADALRDAETAEAQHAQVEACSAPPLPAKLQFYVPLPANLQFYVLSVRQNLEHCMHGIITAISSAVF